MQDKKKKTGNNKKKTKTSSSLLPTVCQELGIRAGQLQKDRIKAATLLTNQSLWEVSHHSYRILTWTHYSFLQKFYIIHLLSFKEQQRIRFKIASVVINGTLSDINYLSSPLSFLLWLQFLIAFTLWCVTHSHNGCSLKKKSIPLFLHEYI